MKTSFSFFVFLYSRLKSNTVAASGWKSFTFSPTLQEMPEKNSFKTALLWLNQSLSGFWQFNSSDKFRRSSFSRCLFALFLFPSPWRIISKHFILETFDLLLHPSIRAAMSHRRQVCVFIKPDLSPELQIIASQNKSLRTFKKSFVSIVNYCSHRLAQNSASCEQEKEKH